MLPKSLKKTSTLIWLIPVSIALLVAALFALIEPVKTGDPKLNNQMLLRLRTPPGLPVVGLNFLKDATGQNTVSLSIGINQSGRTTR